MRAAVRKGHVRNCVASGSSVTSGTASRAGHGYSAPEVRHPSGALQGSEARGPSAPSISRPFDRANGERSGRKRSGRERGCPLRYVADRFTGIGPNRGPSGRAPEMSKSARRRVPESRIGGGEMAGPKASAALHSAANRMDARRRARAAADSETRVLAFGRGRPARRWLVRSNGYLVSPPTYSSGQSSPSKGQYSSLSSRYRAASRESTASCGR